MGFFLTSLVMLFMSVLKEGNTKSSSFPEMDIELQVAGLCLNLLERESKPGQSLPAEGLAGDCQGLTSNT